jgi:hypothetical protein
VEGIMAKKVKNNYDNPKEMAWELFTKTGNPTFYHLYKKLTEK